MEVTLYSIKADKLSELERFEMAARLAGVWPDVGVTIIASQAKCEWWMTPIWHSLSRSITTNNEQQWHRLTAYARLLANRDMVSRSDEGENNGTAL